MSLLIQTREINYKICKDVYEDTHSHEIYAEPLIYDSEQHYDQFRLYFNKSQDLNFLRKLRLIKLFNTNAVVFDNTSDKNKNITKLLNSSFPSKAKEFLFVGSCRNSIKFSKYCDPFCRISSRIVRKVFFSKLVINEHQLKKLMVSSRHVLTIRLVSCKLLINKVIDFSKVLKGTKVQKIDLTCCGKESESDWKTNPEQFSTLIQSLATSEDLKLTLSTLCLMFCEISISEAYRILKLHNFSSTKIIC
ncbi:unnamed protein product [Moneuplotes crassus]|uniref:Uncharacterized protein n=1 Tax=Euplotes crassus TaxID=5936 RepID=A0AAD2D981_EUPCR|nr:unnamed protein product [Moneuplotes crassus]